MAQQLPTIFSRLGLNSLRQRYLFVFVTVSAFILLFAYFGWRYVEQVSKSQLEDIRHRTQAADVLGDLITQLHTIQINLHSYITIPNDKNKKSIADAFRLFNSTLNKLQQNAWLRTDHALSELIYEFSSDRDLLQKEVDLLITVRADKTQWFPAMNVMRDRMLENNMHVKSVLDFMIQDASDDLGSARKVELFRQLSEIRYTWQMMISEFRLFIANSFGVFSNDPVAGMESRRVNIELYIKRIDDLLNKLEKNDRLLKNNAILAQNIVELRNGHRKWSNAYHEIIDSFQGEHWRHDLTLLTKNVQPLLSQIEQRISILQLELAVAETKNITLLTRLAQDISDYVIYVAFTIVLIGVIGFSVFQRTILNPIATFARILKSEAMNRDAAVQNSIESHTTEFRELTDAFNDMQRQVILRQEHLDHMAHHDSLTHLPNRILLRDRLSQAIERAKRDNKMVGLLFLDLDRFKQINDSLGHDIGDKMLQVVAERLRHCVRAVDTVARMGGDEFAIVMEGVTHAEQIASLARKIIKAFVQPFHIEQHELHSSTSIGIALGPNDDTDVDGLIRDADIAMYHAKDLGRGSYKFYSSEMALQVAERMALENQLRNALTDEQFCLHYQPIIDIKTGQITSVEALLRWRHPARGLLTPDNFLFVMEDTGLIRPVTQWVLNEAGRQYIKHKQAGFPQVRMSVNLSGLLFKDESILDLIINTIEHTQMDPNALIVEITEDTLLEDLHGSDEALRILKNMGIRVALDDFGTGQSSLSHLRLTPIDIVKIDRDFVRDIPDDQNDSELVDAVIAMAHKLHMTVVAEGVETQQQLDFLSWHKCDCVQGYYYAKPLESEAILEYLRQSIPSSLAR